MTKKSFITSMLIGLAVFLPIFYYILNFSDPRKGPIVITAFIISIFAVVMCFFALFGFLIRQWRTNNETLNENVRTSLRQGFFGGIYAVGILGLAAVKLLTWWDAVLLAFSLVLFEIYFMSGKEKTN